MRYLMSLSVLLAAAHAGAAPRLALGAYQVKPGDSIVIHATGFTPKSIVVSHLTRPDGTEYPSMSFQADARGEFSHTIVIVPPLTGTYVLQMSEASSKAGATTRFMMTAVGTPPPAKSQGEEMTPAYAAVWQGRAAQSSGAEPSATLVTLAGGRLGAVVGTVAYPSRLCGGQLWLMGVHPGSILLGEMITYGEERCGGRGIITARPVPDGSLSFGWRDALNPSPGTVTGSLTRQE
jgi:hypothetical protein